MMCAARLLVPLAVGRVAHTSRRFEGVKKSPQEQKHFTQRRKQNKAVVLCESLRLGVFA
jgi:hypothetical protein